MLKIDAVNLSHRTALLSSGATVPITNLFDADGDETGSANDAIAFVAGQDNTWFAGLTGDFEASQAN